MTQVAVRMSVIKSGGSPDLYVMKVPDVICK